MKFAPCAEKAQCQLHRVCYKEAHQKAWKCYIDWSALLSDMQQRAPVLTVVLSAATSRKKKKKSFTAAALASCFAVLLKGRMFLLQWICSLVLFAGHAGKQVS